MQRRNRKFSWHGWSMVAALLLAILMTSTAVAQVSRSSSVTSGGVERTVEGPIADRIVSSQIELSRDRARLQLELDDGGALDFSIHDDQAWAGDRALGPARRGESLDREWRDLLNRAMEVPTDELAELLIGWEMSGLSAVTNLTRPGPNAGTKAILRYEIMSGLIGPAPAVATTTGQTGTEEGQVSGAPTDPNDTIARLNLRIAELETRLGRLDEAASTTAKTATSEVKTVKVSPSPANRGRRGQDAWYSPLRHIGRGFMAILGDLAVLAVLVGIGFAVVFFGREKLEAVADTARQETLRSGLVGLAATFLILPGYILGIIALAISIVGIPLLLAWVPLFWVAVGIAALLGYLAVGHGIGEALAERRFYGGEWAKRANSYYYVLTGLIALFALYLAAHAVMMAGPWLGFIRAVLTFMAITLTWLAFTIGLGAVLLTRAGTSPRGGSTTAGNDLGMGDLFEEGTGD